MHSQMSVTSVCSSSYKNTNNSFFISGTYVHLFLDSTATFFWREWKHIFLGAPSQRRSRFFPPFLLLFGCVLEETHGNIFLKVREEYKYYRNGRYFIIKLTLIELYGI